MPELSAAQLDALVEQATVDAFDYDVEDEPEPPVPAGLATLSAPQRALARTARGAWAAGRGLAGRGGGPPGAGAGRGPRGGGWRRWPVARTRPGNAST
ncbi:hypothetical protein [Microbispora sp. H10836]|uniref:hypothetical protein n=1 Tax=Microbispora sp. H10836 TaxID=2729106 RepID=UPI001474C611|nr:hypothetical protein [Microbispora sp. H10836]